MLMPKWGADRARNAARAGRAGGSGTGFGITCVVLWYNGLICRPSNPEYPESSPQVDGVRRQCRSCREQRLALSRMQPGGSGMGVHGRFRQFQLSCLSHMSDYTRGLLLPKRFAGLSHGSGGGSGAGFGITCVA